MKNIHFYDKNGTEISKIESEKKDFAPDVLIEDDEEIIGVYGTKNQDSSGDFFSIGFIVWKPPNY